MLGSLDFVLKIMRNHLKFLSRESNKDLNFQKDNILIVLYV